MTRRAAPKLVHNRDEWKGRRNIGKAGVAKVRADLELNQNPDAWGYVVHDAIPATIAYADALTIKATGMQHTGDHAQLVRTAARSHQVPPSDGYPDLCFHVSLAFFPRTGAWENLRKALRADYEESVWEHLNGAESAPFEASSDTRIAVKVNHCGNELMVVKTIGEALTS